MQNKNAMSSLPNKFGVDSTYRIGIGCRRNNGYFGKVADSLDSSVNLSFLFLGQNEQCRDDGRQGRDGACDETEGMCYQGAVQFEINCNESKETIRKG